MRKTAFVLALAFAFASFAQPVSDETSKLRKLFDEEWEYELREDPEGATSVGDRRYDARLTDRSEAAFERWRAHSREVLARRQAIGRSRLSSDDKLNSDLYLRQTRNAIAGDRFPRELMPLSQRGGIHDNLSELAQAIPRDTVKDHENFLKRMRAFPRSVDE